MLTRLRRRFSSALDRLDAFVARLAHAGLNWLIWPVLYAITAGSGAWMLVHVRRLADVDNNKVGLPDSLQMLHWVGAALGLLGLLYGLWAVWVHRRTRQWQIVRTAGALNRRLRPLLALPVLPGLALPGIEKDSPKLTFVYIALAAFAVGWGAYGWGVDRPPPIGEDEAPLSAPSPTRARRLLGKLGVGFAVLLLWVGYALFFARLSIVNHHALNTRTIDLGYYDNVFYQSIHGRPLACTLIRGGNHSSAHFDPFLVFLSPLYLIYPRAEGILALQAIWLGAGVVPVYLIARDKLGKALPAFLLALMYALYPALHGANMYEFHSLSLVTPVLLWLLWFLERGNYSGYWLAILPAMLLREDIPLVLCFVGLYAILSGRPGAARCGWLTIIVGLIYFVVAKRVFMGSDEVLGTGKESYSYAYYYEDLIPNKNGTKGLLVSLLSNPWFLVKHVFTDAKVQYFLTLFVPLAFLPFLAKTGRVMLTYGLLFCFMASRAAVFSPHFQYSSILMPIAFMLTPMALRQIEDGRAPGALALDGRRLSRALLGGALVASLLCTWKFGGILDNQSFKGGFARVARGLGDKERSRYAWLREAIAQIPPDAVVGVTNVTGCHVSNRKEVYFYPYATTPNTEWFLIDEGELKGGDLDRHNRALQQGKLREVTRFEKLVLYRKK